MKASGLIKKLEALVEQNGDLDVRVYSLDYCMYINKIDCVRVNERNGVHRIEIIVTK